MIEGSVILATKVSDLEWGCCWAAALGRTSGGRKAADARLSPPLFSGCKMNKIDKLTRSFAILLEETQKAFKAAKTEQELRDIKARSMWCMNVVMSILYPPPDES